MWRERAGVHGAVGPGRASGSVQCPAGPALAAAPAAPASSGNLTATKKTARKSTAATASSPEIAAAQASGKVWVNTESGVYHKSGRWYGKTKAGKFMTESEAKAAGYKASQKE